MSRSTLALIAATVVSAGVLTIVGCVNVKAPEEINIGGGGRGREPIDTSRVPPNMSPEEARQKLAEAYDRINYLEGKVRGLEKDKRELKDDLEKRKDELKREKKKNKNQDD
jgi:hypothetical protein